MIGMGNDRLILALDLDDPGTALAVARQTAPWVAAFKVSPAHALANGADFVAAVQSFGRKVFLDLKLYDIPETVARTVRQAARMGVDYLTVHASGGSRMLRAARAAVEEAGGRLTLLAVTVLTSFDEGQLKSEWGLRESLTDRVLTWASLAREAGIPGIVCSPLELGAVRTRFGRDLLTVVPGIRPPDAPPDDQRRTLTAAEAVARGADLLVVGRPILGAPDPAAAAERIGREIAAVPAA